MNTLKRHILIWLFLVTGGTVNASHVLGGEIYYQHLKNNQFKVTLNVYRDCNGCKINGNGGGNSAENCSEIEYVFVKGIDKSSSKETKFSLGREFIKDISPLCRSKISSCYANSNSSIGIELQQFSAIIDLDDSKIAGYCQYYIYVTFAERNNNISTGQAKQNFCIDAFINACLDKKNNSAKIASSPTFIVNHAKTQYPSCFAIDADGDSLVYSLTSPLISIEKAANYGTGYSPNYPLTVYCTEMPPCYGDKNKESGFYLDRFNGSVIFLPIRVSEIGVVVYKVEEYRKVSGNWELIGYIKRDIQISVITSDDNNSPKFLNQDYFEVCEGEELVIKIETKDDKIFSGTKYDSVFYTAQSIPSGANFSQSFQSGPPYNYATLKWKPGKGLSGIYPVSILAKDNFCSTNAYSYQQINIKVKPKEELRIHKRDLGCGNYELSCASLEAQSKLSVKVYDFGNPATELFLTDKTLDTLSLESRGKYVIQAKIVSINGCESYFVDTIFYYNNKTMASILGADSICKEVKYFYTVINLPASGFSVNWNLNGTQAGNGNTISASINQNSKLLAYLAYRNGKWQCSDTLIKSINLIKTPEIIARDNYLTCHNSGIFNVNDLNILPDNGKWFSNSPAFNDGLINTHFNLSSYNDTVICQYEIDYSGCYSSKTIEVIIQAIPEVELSSLTICEIKTPVLLEHLIVKPYKKLDYTYEWSMGGLKDYIKTEKGYLLFYPSESGFGVYRYSAVVKGPNGCSNSDSGTIEITPAVQIKFNNAINLCQNSGPIDVSALSGVNPENGNWSFRDFDLFTNKKFVLTDTCGQFEAEYVYDNFGCYDSKKVLINILCKPDMNIAGIDDQACDSEIPITLQGSPAGGVWENAFIKNNVFSPPLHNESQNYLIQYKIRGDQCEFNASKWVSIHPSPQLDVALLKDRYCKEEPILLSGKIDNGSRLKINYGDWVFEKDLSKHEDFINTPIFNSRLDQQFLTQFIKASAYNNYGCISEKQFGIRVYDVPGITKLKDTFSCHKTDYFVKPTLAFSGVESLKYAWIQNSQEISSARDLNTAKLPVGKHALTFKAFSDYCKSEEGLNIEIKPLPILDFIILPTNTTTIMQPGFHFKNQSREDLNWMWRFGDNRPNNTSSDYSARYTYTDTGIYAVSLKGTDEFGCSNTLEKLVYVRPDLLIYMPNAFSPNNKDEEKNNTFGISLDNYAHFSMEIFDRWGHKLYQSDNPRETWNGKSGEVVCTPDIYFYSIKLISVSGHSYLYRGTITLIR